MNPGLINLVEHLQKYPNLSAQNKTEFDRFDKQIDSHVGATIVCTFIRI